MKTSELTGPALDWAVAKAEGLTDKSPDMPGGPLVQVHDGIAVLAYSIDWARWCPTIKWQEGGPIIERERINLLNFTCFWDASMSSGPRAGKRVNGETPLIAAMRCYVASKLGDTVEIPPELEN